MDSQSPMSVFNTQMINFVIELTEMYPNDTNFKAVYSGLTLLKKTNPRLVSESFKEFVYPFRKEILEPNYNHELIVGEWLITGEYDKNPNIPSPGISLIRKH